MGPLLLLPLLVLGQTHSRWEVHVRTEVRARNGLVTGTADGGVSGNSAAADAEVNPGASGAIFNGPWTLSGAYNATLRTREPYVPRAAGQAIGEHSHNGRVEVLWVREAAARAYLAQSVNYGTLDLSSLNRDVPAGQPVTPLPAVGPGLGVVRDLSFDTSAGVDWYLTKTLTLTTTAGFLYGGGADAASRVSLPLQSTYRGGARLTWLGSPRDTFGLNLAAQYVRFFQVEATPTTPFNPGARIGIGELAFTYLRLLSSETSADMALGVTGIYGQLPNTTPTATMMGPFRDVRDVAPLVALGVTHREQFRAQRVDLRVGAQYAPFVDRFAGTVYQRLEGNGSLTWTHARHLRASVGVGVGRSLPQVGTPVTTVFGEAAAGYAGDPWWRVDLIGRLSLVQSDATPGPIVMPPPDPPVIARAPPLENQWVVGVSLTLMAASEQPRIVRDQQQ